MLFLNFPAGRLQDILRGLLNYAPSSLARVFAGLVLCGFVYLRSDPRVFMVFCRFVVFLFFCPAGFFGLHGPFLFRPASNLGCLGGDKLPMGAATLPPEGPSHILIAQSLQEASRGATYRDYPIWLCAHPNGFFCGINPGK